MHAWFLHVFVRAFSKIIVFLFYALSCPESNIIFFLGPPKNPHKKVPLFFFFIEISTALTATTTNHCQVCYILPYPNFPHMGSDLSKLHHSAPYCPTQELPKKLHATSRHPKLIAHVHNFKIILPTHYTMNSEPPNDDDDVDWHDWKSP